MPSRHSSFSEETPKRNYSYVSAIAIATIEILLSHLILCYGIFLMRFVLHEFYTLEDGLWAVVSYTASKKFTQPWALSFCKHAKLSRKRIDKRNIIISAFLLSIVIFTICLVHTKISHTFIYGVGCGFFVTIIQSHLKSYTSDVYEPLELILQPISLCFVPHLILFLTDIYDIPQTELIISALILNIIPACLTIKNVSDDDSAKIGKSKLHKLPTLSKLSVELTNLNGSKESIESSDDGEEYEDIGVRNEAVGTEVEGVAYQNYALLNKFLPGIPEEHEPDEEADDMINEASLQRMIRINEHLHGFNNLRRDSVNNYYDENMETCSIMSDLKEEVPTHPPDETKSRCFSISSGTLYSIKTNRKHLKHFLIEHFIGSIPRTLKCFYFYPTVICSGILSFLSPIFLATAPIIALEKSETGLQNEWTIADSTFLLSIIGFAWTFFLIAYPILKRLSIFKKRLTFISGILITGFSYFVAQKFTNHHLTGCCLIFGFGHGIISFTETIAYREFCGEEEWKKLRGPVEMCTAFLVILAYSTIYNLWDVRTILLYAHWPYAFCAGLWTISHILKWFIFHCRNCRRYRKERYPKI